MKAILKSESPKSLMQIANGDKTIIISKVKPSCDLPIDVYLRCTKQKERTIFDGNSIYDDELYRLPNGKIKYGCSIELMCCDNYTKDNFLNGKVVAKFTSNKANRINTIYYRSNYGVIEHSEVGDTKELCNKACLTIEELLDYKKNKTLYAWHIDNLVIFDKPKELSEFMPYYENWKTYCHEDSGCESCPAFDKNMNCKRDVGLTKAPTTWRYVEVKL